MRVFVTTAGNLLGGAVVALVYAGYTLLTGTRATPAVLGGLVMGGLTFVVLFIVTRALPPRQD
jgi:hypothetical protein